MNQWARLASYALIAAAIGHFVIVDLSLWILEANYVHVFPDSFLSHMKSAVFNWGALGKNNVLNVFAGFSLWVPISLSLIGVHNLFIFRQLPPGHKVRLHSMILGLLASFIFLLLAIVCFIYPAVVGAATAGGLFGLGIRKEKALVSGETNEG